MQIADGALAGRFEGLRDAALQIRNETPYALVSGISGVVYEICWYMRGLERWLMDTIEQPGEVRMISKPGRIVWAVVWTAPETIPSAWPLWTIMVPK